MVTKCARELRLLIEDIIETSRFAIEKREDIAYFIITERIKRGIEDLEKCLGEELPLIRTHFEEAKKYAKQSVWDEAVRELGMIASSAIDEVLIGRAEHE
jgi:hypothetical protein